MARLSTNFTPSADATKVLDGLDKQLGMTPNIFKLMAQAPNVLQGYMAFNSALAKGTLSGQEREQIALAVSGFDKCTYCASAHTAIAKKTGLDSQETQLNLKGKSATPKIEALLNFTLAVVQTKGNVTDFTHSRLL